jgi:3' terminal RNA ribose 2'-O-methyltransferase Hen1
VSALRSADDETILDLGCGEGKLLRLLLKDSHFKKIIGMDVSIKSLESAAERLNLENLPPKQRERIELMHGSLIYRDRRLEGYDAAAVVEVIEHLDEPRLRAFERVLFEFARPAIVVLTTPNREYNVRWENVGPDKFRHKDHRFEWTREECLQWAKKITELFGYTVRFLPIGKVDAEVGSPTQMCIFTRNDNSGKNVG